MILVSGRTLSVAIKRERSIEGSVPAGGARVSRSSVRIPAAAGSRSPARPGGGRSSFGPRGSRRSVLAGTCCGQPRGLRGFEQSPVVGDEGDELRPGLVGQHPGGGEVDGVETAQRRFSERGGGRADRAVDL